MSSKGYSFKKFIFLGLDDRQIDLVKKIKYELGEGDDPRYWVFMQNPEELHYHLDRQSVLVLQETRVPELSRVLLNDGHPFFIPWKIFLQNFYSLINLETTRLEKKVCLAFLPQNLGRLFEAMFCFYGIQTVKTGNIPELEKNLNAGMDYLVFDLDMNLVSEKEKYKMMQTIKYFCKQGLTASVIKNFDKGSLFNDLMSPVKEISNILLSPEEYLLFLRKYLYFKEVENFYNESGNPVEIKSRYNIDENFIKGIKSRPSLFSDLKDAKKAYSRLQSIKPEVIYNKVVQNQNNLYLKYVLSESIAALIQTESDNSQRELFTFFTH